MAVPLTHTITPAEVELWFGRQRKYRLSAASYEQIAVRLSKYRWANDPAPPRRPLNEPIPSNRIPIGGIFEAQSGQWIRFSIAFQQCCATGKARVGTPRHEPALTPSCASRKALKRARPYIESPFGGPPIRQSMRGRRKPIKKWHTMAQLVMNLVGPMIFDDPLKWATSKNAILAKITTRRPYSNGLWCRKGCGRSSPQPLA